MKRLYNNLRNVIIVLGLAGICFILPPQTGLAQAPNNLDNFLDDEDFEAPPLPPGTPQNPNMNRKNFGADVNNPPPDTGNTNPGGGATGGVSGKPTPRRNRNEKPNLLAHRPANMNTVPDAEITDENFPDLIDSFDYPNAEISDIVKAISELTGRNFIVDPQVRGKITIIAPSKITVAEAYKAFLSALAINGLTVVPSGKFWKVKQAQNAQRDNLDTYSGSYSPNVDNMITRIIQLKFISAKEVYNSLGPILQSRLGEMRVYEPTNTIIISDYGTNIDRIMKIMRQLDVPGFEEQLEVIRVKYAKASDLAKLIDQIINKGKNTQQGNAFTAGIPRFTPLGGMPSGGGNEAYSMVMPDDRTNSLILVGNTQGIDKIRKLVAKLDFKLRPEDAGGVYVYYVRFGDAEKIATTLSGLAQASAQANQGAVVPGAPGAAPVAKQGVFSADVKIVSDKTTNSLIVTASKQDYEVVRAILNKLDVPRDQVYVEGVIAEIEIDKVKNWGMTAYYFPTNSAVARGGFSSTQFNLGQVLNPLGDQGAIIPFSAGDTVQLTLAGQTVNVTNVAGMINFLATHTDINVLSTPQIIAMDNEEAEIEVGANVPVASAPSTTTTGVTTVQVTREPVTIKLNVKPHISPGSTSMRLEINQQVKDVAQMNIAAKNLADNAIATTTRSTKTSVLVHDRDTIVLGGLMHDQDTVSTSKIPLLGDIPIIGWLFKGKNVNTKKQNLLMFLTPKIIRNTDKSAEELLTSKLRERTNWIERNAGGTDVEGDVLDSLQLQKNGKPVNVKTAQPGASTPQEVKTQ